MRCNIIIILRKSGGTTHVHTHTLYYGLIKSLVEASPKGLKWQRRPHRAHPCSGSAKSGIGGGVHRVVSGKASTIINVIMFLPLFSPSPSIIPGLSSDSDTDVTLTLLLASTAYAQLCNDITKHLSPPPPPPPIPAAALPLHGCALWASLPL